MKTWQKALIPTVITLLVGGIYLFTIWRQRHNPGVGGRQTQTQPLKSDDLAVVREKFMQHYDDVLALAGTTVWMKNGYTIPYYPYRNRVEFHRAGLVPPDQRLDIKKIVKATPPADEDDGMSHGSRQVFVVFTFPDDSKQYALPIGVMDGANEAYFGNLLFYYDDPHTIYDNWPKDVWAAIDAHQVKPGMNELQARTAVGQKITSNGGSPGNRTITYDANGKHWTVTFVADHATAVHSD